MPPGNVEVMEEAGDVGGHGQPPLSLGSELLEGQPVPVADPDGIGRAPGGQQAQHVRWKKAASIPCFEWRVRAEPP
jgi:hypothetical protein